MAKKPSIQYAALPFVIRDGQPLVMLVTSLDTRKWIIPKGWPEKKLKPHAVAAREAFEEAGLVGDIQKRSCAEFEYVKRLKSGKCLSCVMKVFAFAVREELEDWPEKGLRDKIWVSPAEAAMMVTDSGLVDMLLRLAAPDI